MFIAETGSTIANAFEFYVEREPDSVLLVHLLQS